MASLKLLTMVLVVLSTSLECFSTTINQTYVDERCRHFAAKNITIENCSCTTLKERIHWFNCRGETTGQSCTITTITRIRAITNIVSSSLGVIGNLLVIVVRFPIRKQWMHYNLIVGLATADFIYSLLNLILSAPELNMCGWVYGVVFCKLSKSLLATSFAIDVAFILVIASERYYGIVHPYRENWSTLKSCVIKLSLIAACAVMAVPLLIVYDVKDGISCLPDWSKISSSNFSLIYNWCLFIGFFLLPVTTITFLYVRCTHCLNRTIFGQDMLANLDEVTRARFVKDNRRILLVVCAILLCFFLLVSPTFLVLLYYNHKSTRSSPDYETIRILKLVISLTYLSHTAANPLIYSILDPSFRKSLAKMFGCGNRVNTEDHFYTLHAGELNTVALGNIHSVEWR